MAVTVQAHTILHHNKKPDERFPVSIPTKEIPCYELRGEFEKASHMGKVSPPPVVVLQYDPERAFNRVVIAHLRKDDQAVDGIYRIARSSETPSKVPKHEELLCKDIQDNVAMLQLLKRHNIPAPNFLAFDASREKPLELSLHLYCSLPEHLPCRHLPQDYSPRETKHCRGTGGIPAHYVSRTFPRTGIL
ncbi:hypothetical protein K470DRAFT_262278 [Piedraia hortae CBS 480.64]|uniref:Uncharacterized protein n=1 Tax=Piedraia hortae CBS 480.64 TaxID=1314780 RepID=A0A6A7C6T4_9PEZI|nr:hypothetical protein K470DRAFT_262278 [Piedraia hortae CBS 480.64]